jgi:hypothetical protein
MNRYIVGLYLIAIAVWTFSVPAIYRQGPLYPDVSTESTEFARREVLWSLFGHTRINLGQALLELGLITLFFAGLNWIFRPKKS